MKIMSENEIIEKFFESGRLIEKAIYEGNHRLNNREMRKMYKLYKNVSVLDRDMFLNKCVPVMLEDGNYPVKIQTCNFLFDMHIREKEMEEFLKGIVKDSNAGIFSHQAELILHSRGIKIN